MGPGSAATATATAAAAAATAVVATAERKERERNAARLQKAWKAAEASMKAVEEVRSGYWCALISHIHICIFGGSPTC
jgi:hypothetical protein